MTSETTKKVKILVLGDSAVGKTSLVHLICTKEALSNPAWTVGCSLEVKLHEYGTGSLTQPYFLEFWDVGGSPAHANGRQVFYHQANGIVLVYDLTNRKSHTNLLKWLGEYHQSVSGGKGTSKSDTEYDPESFVEQSIPMIVVGTKQDLADSPLLKTTSMVTGADLITVDCTNVRQFSLDSPLVIQLNKFFDKVIERRFFPSYHMVSERVQLIE
ncbi:hypothetical protein EMCRGX_G034465 [Ephydatia muelleri]|eukprot:Em0023g384a